MLRKKRIPILVSMLIFAMFTASGCEKKDPEDERVLVAYNEKTADKLKDFSTEVETETERVTEVVETENKGE